MVLKEVYGLDPPKDKEPRDPRTGLTKTDVEELRAIYETGMFLPVFLPKP